MYAVAGLPMDELAEKVASARPIGNTRVTGKEQYYTPPNIARKVVGQVLRTIPEAAHRTWLEPAGGTGTFIDAAREAGIGKVISFDIEPHHPEVALGDFLTQPLALTGGVAIGNPPFGRNNSLSIPFFNRAAVHCDFIAYIVPRSWRKWSVLNRLDRAFHLITDTNLSINYVDVHGNDAYAKNNLRTCVQMWERRATKRHLMAVHDKGIIKRCKVADADVSLTIFGYSCGTVLTDFPRRTVTTQMYLQLQHPRALEALRNVDYGRFSNNVAYTQALSLPEINYLLNDYLFGDPMLVSAGGDADASCTLF